MGDFQILILLSSLYPVLAKLKILTLVSYIIPCPLYQDRATNYCQLSGNVRPNLTFCPIELFNDY